MTGWTLDELCTELDQTPKAIEARLWRAKIRPLTRQALYPPDTLDKIRDVTIGRPKKQEAVKPAKPKTRRKTKK